MSYRFELAVKAFKKNFSTTKRGSVLIQRNTFRFVIIFHYFKKLQLSHELKCLAKIVVVSFGDFWLSNFRPLINSTSALF